MDFYTSVRGSLGSWWAALRDWGTNQSIDPSTIRPLICVRAALGIVTLGTVVQAQAHTSYLNSSSNFTPSDSVVWDAMGRDGTVLFNPSVWTTRAGLRFKISKPNSGSMRLETQTLDDGRVLCVNTTDSSTIHIEFDQPVSAAAAQVVISRSGYASLTMKAMDQRGGVLLQSSEVVTPGVNTPCRYMGALANTDQIKSIDYSTDTGTIELGRMDLLESTNFGVVRNPQASDPRQASLPCVQDQNFYTVKNGAMVANSSVSMGARNVTRFVVLKAPAHASFFQLFSDGVFAYRPEANFSGTDSFVFAGLCADGITQSLPGTASINVAWANSAPLFKGGPDQVSNEDGGVQVIPHWATQISAGSPDEDRHQRLTWIVNTDQPLLFLEQPTLSLDGTLRYSPAPHASGIAHVTAWLKDDGGTANGGTDTSTPYEFTITFQPVTHRPILTDLPEQTLEEGQVLNVRATASSMDLGKVVVYSLENAPQGMTIDPISGLLTWAPRSEQFPGIYDVTIRAAVAGQESYADRRPIRINALRHATGPVLLPIPSRVAKVGDMVHFHVEANSDMNQLQYLLGSSNGNATLDSKTGDFNWKPSNEDAGKNHTFLISAFDPKTGASSNVSVFTVAVESPTSNPATPANTILPASTTSTEVQTMKIVGFTEPAKPSTDSHDSRHSKKYTPKTHKPVRARTSAARRRRQTRHRVH